jgi:hypothetical protein
MGGGHRRAGAISTLLLLWRGSSRVATAPDSSRSREREPAPATGGQRVGRRCASWTAIARMLSWSSRPARRSRRARRRRFNTGTRRIVGEVSSGTSAPMKQNAPRLAVLVVLGVDDVDAAWDDGDVVDVRSGAGNPPVVQNEGVGAALRQIERRRFLAASPDFPDPLVRGRLPDGEQRAAHQRMSLPRPPLAVGAPARLLAIGTRAGDAEIKFIRRGIAGIRRHRENRHRRSRRTPPPLVEVEARSETSWPFSPMP